MGDIGVFRVLGQKLAVGLLGLGQSAGAVVVDGGLEGLVTHTLNYSHGLILGKQGGRGDNRKLRHVRPPPGAGSADDTIITVQRPEIT
jgi:hypothetical protein